jgi:hypothetical protein
MPLHENKLVKLLPPPVITPEKKYFVVRFTSEIFDNYQDYLSRIEFYQRRVFTCARTKKSKLTYEEALMSEIEHKRQADELEQEIQQHPPPPHSTDFGFETASYYCVTKIIPLWKFLNGFRSILHLAPFSLDDFFNALEYKKQNHLMINVAFSLLQVVAGGKRKTLTLQNWPSFLKEFLVSHKPDFQYFDIVPKLNKKGGFFSLNVEEKITILDYIFESSLQTEEIREEFEEHTNKFRNLLKEKRAIELSINKIKKGKTSQKKVATPENEGEEKKEEEEEEPEDIETLKKKLEKFVCFSRSFKDALSCFVSSLKFLLYYHYN